MELVLNDDFFAPVNTDAISAIVAECAGERAKIEQLARYMHAGDYSNSLCHFIEGNGPKDRHWTFSLAALFQLEGAIGSLNSKYWNKVIEKFGLYDIMPTKRRSEWREQISNPLGTKKDRHSKDYLIQPLPEFNDANVRSTVISLLDMRPRFIAERVDGIFTGLSREHVTNSPEAFGKRMIINNVFFNEYSSNYGKIGLIHDLRCVIAKFMGRDDPSHVMSDVLIRNLKRNWGEWVPVDGGAFKIRLYRKGTAHMEVHPEMAWRLNSILAHLHPLAIPSEFRKKPSKKSKNIELIQRPLPFEVLNALSKVEVATLMDDMIRYTYKEVPMHYEIHGECDKHVLSEVSKIMCSLGGVPVQIKKGDVWKFDYDLIPVLGLILCSGCVPDSKSHQFYPTPGNLARTAVDLACIQPGHSVLEPSAGVGGIADSLPKEDTTCVEVSSIHCEVLKSKGYSVVCGDFMSHTGRYDKIVMNPPFDRGQWLAHLEHAASLLNDGGRLVAILPTSAQNKDMLQGFTKEWHGPFENEFAKTGISVIILVLDK
jgi:hypothetical protein